MTRLLLLLTFMSASSCVFAAWCFVFNHTRLMGIFDGRAVTCSIMFAIINVALLAVAAVGALRRRASALDILTTSRWFMVACLHSMLWNGACVLWVAAMETNRLTDPQILLSGWASLAVAGLSQKLIRRV